MSWSATAVPVPTRGPTKRLKPTATVILSNNGCAYRFTPDAADQLADELRAAAAAGRKLQGQTTPSREGIGC